MHMTWGTVSTLRLENVCEPEQPLKLCPTVIVVTLSSEDTENVMGLPCEVVPDHCPSIAGRDGDVSLPQAVNSAHIATVSRRGFV
jgi:hypothetical protein